MKFTINGKCKECGNKSFKLRKRVEGASKHKVVLNETLCHDGCGYDLNTFDIICSKCRKENTDVFELKRRKTK